MSDDKCEMDLVLPRHAFSPREAARAGDLWRACQEAAVEASSRIGWPPARYREERTAFVVHTMTVLHHRETWFGEKLRARTWVWRFRRDTLSTREVRIVGASGERLVSATQGWVHVGADLRPKRASRELVDAFAVFEDEPSVKLPSFVSAPSGDAERLSFRCWHTWMDPLGHVNHPAYVDWVDEAIARRLVARQLAPADVRPVAEKLSFKFGVVADDEVEVTVRALGRTAERDLVLGADIRRADGVLCASGTFVRTLASGNPEPLLRAFGL